MKTRRLLPILIFISILSSLVLCSCVDFSAYAADTESDAPSATGEVIYIDDEADFLEMFRTASLYPNNPNTYILRNDIYLDRYYSDNDPDIYLDEFSGTLLGRGHAIVGLTVTPSYVTYNESDGQGGTVDKYAYISAFIGKNTGTVKDLKLVDLYLSDGQTGFTDVVYAPIGINEGTVEDVKALFTADGVPESSSLTYKNIGEGYSKGVCVLADFVEATAGSETYEVNDVFTLAMAFNAGGSITLTGDVNLYNSELFADKAEKLRNISDTSDTYGFYNASAYGLNGIPDKNAINNLPPAAESLSEEGTEEGTEKGTEESPFEISSISELLYLKGNSSADTYYMLTDDISLTGYIQSGSNGSLVGDFSGVLDGNGHAVTGLKTSFVSSLSEGSVIKNLRLDFDFDGVGLKNVSGSLIGVTASGKAGVFASFSGGTGTAEAVSGGTGTAEAVSVLKESSDVGIGTAFSGKPKSLYRVRSFADVFFVNVSGSFNADNCYQDNGKWGTEELPSGKFSDGSAADTDRIESLITATNTGPSNVLSHSGWQFAAEPGFAVPKGSEAAVLVFPEDRTEYKSVPVFAKIKTKSVVYGDSLITSDNFFTEYPPDDAGFADNDSLLIYELNEFIDGLLSDSIPLDDTAAGFAWKNALGQAVSGEVNKSSYTDGTLNLEYYSLGSYLLDLTLGVVNSEWVLSGAIVEFAYDAAKFSYIYDSEMSFVDNFGLTPDDQNLFGYRGVTLTVKQGDNTIIDAAESKYAKGLIYSPGTYTVIIDIPGSNECTPARVTASFRIDKGNIDYAVENSSLSEERDGKTVKGGFSEDTAFEYGSLTGPVVPVLPDLWLNIIGRVEISYTVTGYNPVIGNPTAKSSINDAGTYMLEITVSAPNFNDLIVPSTVYYYVKPAEKVISVNAPNELQYGDELPVLTGKAEGDAKVYALTVSETNYGRFSVPRDDNYYFADYKVSSEYGDNNYVFVYASPSEDNEGAGRYVFNVAKKQVTFKDLMAAGVFNDLEVVYDGGEHSLSFDESKFPYVAGDINKGEGKYVFSAEYLHDGVESSEPFDFADAGKYTVELESLVMTGAYAYYDILVLDAGSYNAELTILQRGVTIKASDVSLDYNALPPQYGYTLIATDPDYPIDDFADSIGSELERGVHFDITCAYTQWQLPSDTAIDITVSIIKDLTNFALTAENGSLTVNKIDFSDDANISVQDSYVYDFGAADIEFTGKYSPENVGDAFKKDGSYFAEGYPKYYLEKGAGRVYLGTTAPADANADGENYLIELKAANTEVFTDGETEFRFTISRLTPQFEVELWTSKGGKKDVNGEYFFDGDEYQLTANAPGISEISGMLFKDLFLTTAVYHADGTMQTVSDRTVRFSEPVKLTDIVFTIIPKAAYENNLNGGTLTLSSFTLNKKELTADGGEHTLTYNGKDLYSTLVSASGLSFDAVENYPVAMTYSVYRAYSEGTVSSPTDVAQYPGSYYLTFAEDDHYTFGGVVEIKIIPYVMNIDLSAGEEEFYGHVSWTADGTLRVNNYVYSDDNFSGSTGLYLTITDEYCDYFGVLGDYVGSGYAEPFVYNVSAADPVTASDIFTAERVNTIEFKILNGEKAFTVRPAEVSLNEVQDSFEYGSDVTASINAAVRIQGAQSGGLIKVVYDGGVSDYSDLNVGPHTFTVLLNQPSQKTDRYVWIGENEFRFVIYPRSFEYSVTAAEAMATDAVPETFGYTLKYNGQTAALPDGVNVGFEISGDLVTGGLMNAGVYDVDMVFGGAAVGNYVFYKAEDSGKFTVSLNTLPANIALRVTEYTYTGYETELLFENAPAGTVAENVPSDAGTYSAELTLSAPGYETETRSFDFTILRATPQVRVRNAEIEFETGYTLTAADVDGEASLGDLIAEGEFVFEGDALLVYGLSEYKLTFVPNDSRNLETVTGISLYVNGYVSAAKADEYFSVSLSKEAGGETVIEPLPPTGEGEGTALIISVSAKVAADVTATLAGTQLKLIDSGTGVKLFSAEIRAGLSGELVFYIQGKPVKSISLSISPAHSQETPDPDDPDDPDDPEQGESGDGGNSMGSGGEEASPGDQTDGGSSGDNVSVNISEEGKKTLIITGSSVGGALLLAGVIILIVVIVKRKKKSGGYRPEG